MNKTTVIATLILLIGVGLLVQALAESDPYANFQIASADGAGHKIIGQLMKDKPMVQNQENPDHFSFWLRDDEGTEREVVLLQPKPRDFEMSEQIVLTGRMEGDVFLASDIQLKCPSKYKDEEDMLQDLLEE